MAEAITAQHSSNIEEWADELANSAPKSTIALFTHQFTQSQIAHP